MTDHAALAASLTSPEAALAITDEPKVLGAKMQAARAYELWSSADSRYVGEYHGIAAPGGSGTGWVIGVFWDPMQVTPDLDAITLAINSSLPPKMTKDDAKATMKGRDKKQGAFFVWQGVAQRPLSQWFHERFGVHALAKQVIDRSDFTMDTAIVVVKDGVDHVWPTTSGA